MCDWPNYDFPTAKEDDSPPSLSQKGLKFVNDNIPTLGIVWNSTEDLLTIALGAYIGALLSTAYANVPLFSNATPNDVWPVVLTLLFLYVITLYGMRFSAFLLQTAWNDFYHPS